MSLLKWWSSLSYPTKDFNGSEKTSEALCISHQALALGSVFLTIVLLLLVPFKRKPAGSFAQLHSRREAKREVSQMIHIMLALVLSSRSVSSVVKQSFSSRLDHHHLLIEIWFFFFLRTVPFCGAHVKRERRGKINCKIKWNSLLEEERSKRLLTACVAKDFATWSERKICKKL